MQSKNLKPLECYRKMKFLFFRKRNLMSNKKMASFITGYVLVLFMGNTFANGLAPPRSQVIDKFGVNFATGQVTTNLNTLSIGGGMGLSHSISSHTNSYMQVREEPIDPQRPTDGGTIVGPIYYAYTDKYGGSAKYELLAANFKLISESPAPDFPLFKVMKVFDSDSSEEFMILVNGQIIGNIPSDSSVPSYTYLALADRRSTLKVNGNFLEWTKADGTLTRYIRKPNAGPTDFGGLYDITYPNGYKVDIRKVTHPNGVFTSTVSVQSNTGFQLKYVHEVDNRPLDPAKTSGTRNPYIPADSNTWSFVNPKKIMGVNNAIDYCSTNDDLPCNVTKNWPTATFNWPAGMPRAFYVGSSTFSVVDALNRTTEYFITALDRREVELFGGGKDVLGGTIDRGFIPRLKAIKDATSQVVTNEFSYQSIASNATNGIPVYEWFPYWVEVQAGRIWNVLSLKGSSCYSNQYVGALSTDTGLQGKKCRDDLFAESDLVRVLLVPASYPGRILKVETKDSVIWFNKDWMNQIHQVIENAADEIGPTTQYKYDDRNNLIRVELFQKNNVLINSTVAQYPASPCVNPKTCNQAEWIKNANGQYTYYSYHAESGQVATVTSPPDKNGIAAVTRYGYEQKFAKYYQDSSGVKKTAPTGIWLKTSEKICMKTATVGDACAGGASDEVITRFEYNHDNLLLTGMTALATGTSPVPKRTCYQYDIYGNRIGETQPNANLTSCN
jgi:hypothetical protein